MKLFKRPPDVIIGTKESPYMLRWHVIPRNKFFNIYLHKFLRSDEDRALHDHPWWNISLLLRGRYLEHMPMDPELWKNQGDRQETVKERRPGLPVFRPASAIHRIELLKEWVPFIPRWGMSLGVERPVWSLFITGPHVREWGFWCPFGFRHHKDFIQVRNGVSDIGRGCE